MSVIAEPVRQVTGRHLIQRAHDSPQALVHRAGETHGGRDHRDRADATISRVTTKSSLEVSFDSFWIAAEPASRRSMVAPTTSSVASLAVCTASNPVRALA